MPIRRSTYPETLGYPDPNRRKTRDEALAMASALYLPDAAEWAATNEVTPLTYSGGWNGWIGTCSFLATTHTWDMVHESIRRRPIQHEGIIPA